MKTIFLLAFLGLSCLVGLVPQALAWYGPSGGQGCGDDQSCGPDTGGQYCQNQCTPPIGYGSGCGGYCAGQQDAAYDVQNNLQYQPYGSCLPCHSEGYWNNFHSGYDSYWNQHQEQNQGSSVNINNSPNAYVSVNQYQQQNPLQQLAHLACGYLNCNQGGPPQ